MCNGGHFLFLQNYLNEISVSGSKIAIMGLVPRPLKVFQVETLSQQFQTSQ